MKALGTIDSRGSLALTSATCINVNLFILLGIFIIMNSIRMSNSERTSESPLTLLEYRHLE